MEGRETGVYILPNQRAAYRTRNGGPMKYSFRSGKISDDQSFWKSEFPAAGNSQEVARTDLVGALKDILPWRCPEVTNIHNVPRVGRTRWLLSLLPASKLLDFPLEASRRVVMLSPGATWYDIATARPTWCLPGRFSGSQMNRIFLNFAFTRVLIRSAHSSFLYLHAEPLRTPSNHN